MPAETESPLHVMGRGTGAGPAGEPDPELLRLPRRSRRPRPVVAAALALFAVYLGLLWRDDLRYFLQPRAPKDLGTATAASLTGARSGTFVTLRGRPQHPVALVLGERGASHVQLLSPLIGTSGRVLLAMDDTAPSEADAFSDRHSGRLLALDDAPFAGEIREALARTMIPSYVRPVDLMSALASSATSLTDELGERIPLAPQTHLEITMTFRDEALVCFDRTRFTDAEADRVVQDVVARTGGVAVGPVSRSADETMLDYVVRLPGGADGPLAHSLAAGFERYAGKVSIEPRMADIEVPAEAAHADPEHLQLSIDAAAQDALVAPPVLYQEVPPSPAEPPTSHAGASASEPAERRLRPAPLGRIFAIPVADVVHARVLHSAAPPQDSWVVVDGDVPSRYWYVPMLYALLLGVAVFNVLALRAGLRERSRTP